MDTRSAFRRELGRGELVRLLYRLGHQQASGVLTIRIAATTPPPPPGAREVTRIGSAPHARGDVLVLRRGAVILAEGELAKKTLINRLARLVSLDRCIAMFEGGNSYPPGPQHQLPLAGWARTHLEAQLDNSLAERLVRELAGMRLSVRAELVPDDASCDEADRRMLFALTQPRRIDQINSLSRTPRFRMLSFLWFLRAIDALVLDGVVAERSAPTRVIDPQREAAARTLGLADGADLETVKRAYRRLARSLHPDLQPDVDVDRRRSLEMRFAEVTAAYEALV